MVLVDTTVWIDYLGGIANPQTVWLEHGLGRRHIGLADLTFCEILQGVRSDSQFLRFRRDLETLPILDTGGRALALATAENYRVLTKRGITVRTTIDCLIATFCILNGYGLLHRDRDFDPFEAHLGLLVIHP